eukprot:10593695-Alexandrium_andersonii.AAC.1
MCLRARAFAHSRALAYSRVRHTRSRPHALTLPRALARSRTRAFRAAYESDRIRPLTRALARSCAHTLTHLLSNRRLSWRGACGAAECSQEPVLSGPTLALQWP